MALSISAVVLLAIVVFLLVKKSGLKAGMRSSACCSASIWPPRPSLPTISELTTNIAGMIGSIKF